MDVARVAAPEWKRLHETLRAALREAVPDGSTIVLVDYPVTPNVGDLIMWLGTEEWIRQARLRVLGRWNIWNVEVTRLPADATIVLTGGGNFGDLYPHHQWMRERLARSMPDARIVQLPQTIHFRHRRTLDRSRRALSRHRQLWMFARCHRSAAIARGSLGLERVVVAPDMAMFLKGATMWPAVRRGHRVMALMRRDKERAESELEGVRPDWQGDWTDLIGIRRTAWLHAMRVRAVLDRAPRHERQIASTCLEMAEAVVTHAAQRMSTADRVITSRLHGHLLACLLDIPSTLLDNSYGKNASYYDAWHASVPSAALGSRSPLRPTP